MVRARSNGSKKGLNLWSKPLFLLWEGRRGLISRPSRLYWLDVPTKLIYAAVRGGTGFDHEVYARFAST